MGSLLEDLQSVLNEQESAKRFSVPDASDEMIQKLCDPQTPFREWDSLSFDFLKDFGLSIHTFPTLCRSTDQSSRERFDPLWSCDEVCGELVLSPNFSEEILF